MGMNGRDTGKHAGIRWQGGPVAPPAGRPHHRPSNRPGAAPPATRRQQRSGNLPAPGSSEDCCAIQLLNGKPRLAWRLARRYVSTWGHPLPVFVS